MGGHNSIVDFKIMAKDTEQDLTILEVKGSQANHGTPLHIHHSQDETFYVLEGEFYFQLDKEKYRLKTGDTIFYPEQFNTHGFKLSLQNLALLRTG